MWRYTTVLTRRGRKAACPWNEHRLNETESEMTQQQLFPVTVVGSWPLPPYLIEERRRRQRGEITFEEVQKVADEAVLEALRWQEEAGVDIVTDGEQRRDNFYSF